MPRRQKWFGCACCPPNIARTLASLGEYVFFRDDTSLWINLFVSGKYRAQFDGVPVILSIESELPFDGMVSIAVETTGEGSLKLRIPEYAGKPQILIDGNEIPLRTEKGYAVVPIMGNAQITYRFEMSADLIYANPNVPADAGKCSVKKGPLVYCLEEQDNGENLAGLILDPTKPLKELWRNDLLGGILTVNAEGYRLNRKEFDKVLYRNSPPTYEKTELRFIPYCYWANREEGEMAVWVKYRL